MGGSFPLEMRREWGQFHSSPTRTSLFSELNAVLHLVLVQDGVCWLFTQRRDCLGQPGTGGPPAASSGFCQDKTARPFLAIHIRGLRLSFPGFELALIVLKGFSWHGHEGKVAWGPDRSSRGYRRLRPHLSSPRGVVGPRCPA